MLADVIHTQKFLCQNKKSRLFILGEIFGIDKGIGVYYSQGDIMNYEQIYKAYRDIYLKVSKYCQSVTQDGRIELDTFGIYNNVVHATFYVDMGFSEIDVRDYRSIEFDVNLIENA